MNYIVRVYADLIRKGQKIIDQVPEAIREEVAALIESFENGKKKNGTK